VCLFGVDCLNLVCVLSAYFFTGRIPASPLDRLWGVLVPPVARHVLHLTNFKFQPITSGDSVSDYVEYLTWALISVVATVVWSLLDRKKTNYYRLNQWLRLYAQVALGVIMMSYGFDKVFPLQFGELTASRLVATVGDLSPFGMLWVFMAASKPYTIFSGVLEVLAGTMLVLPRLRAMGALLAVAVLTNVFALNVFYDVPVKSFSLQLLLLAIFLASPEFPRLVSALVLNRTVAPRSEVRLADNERVTNWARWVQAAVAAAFFVAFLIGSAHRYTNRSAATRNLAFSGMWEVDQFKPAINAGPLFTPKLAAEMQIQQPGDGCWRKFIIERPGSALLQLENGLFDQVDISFSKDHAQLNLSDSDDPKWKAKLAIQQPATDLLSLDGTVNGAHVQIQLHASKRRFRLTSGEYRMIRTYP
jgi:uncharacterized membrane protein YphA (DoxX/SURF4 family)